jgi:cellulose biosynthesis protein BcsQ
MICIPSSIGFPLLSRTIYQYTKDTGKSLRSIGIVFTMADENTIIMKDTMKEYREKYKAEVFKDFMKHSTTIARAVSENL